MHTFSGFPYWRKLVRFSNIFQGFVIVVVVEPIFFFDQEIFTKTTKSFFSTQSPPTTVLLKIFSATISYESFCQTQKQDLISKIHHESTLMWTNTLLPESFTAATESRPHWVANVTEWKSRVQTRRFITAWELNYNNIREWLILYFESLVTGAEFTPLGKYRFNFPILTPSFSSSCNIIVTAPFPTHLSRTI